MDEPSAPASTAAFDYYRRGLRSIAAEIEEREDCAKRRAQRELARDKNKVSVPAKEPISPHSESELR